MAQERENSVLRKKAEAAKPAPDSAPMTPEKAIAQSLSKVAQEMLDLPLRVTELVETRRGLADLPEMLEDLSLLAIIEGPGEGLGLVALPPATLSVLIEMQTMGRLGKTAPGPRKPTRIDAAMAADFLDALLATIEATLIEEEAIAWAGGFRYASHLDDPRPLGLLLEDISYRVWSARLAFGTGGEREGGFLWAVPQSGRGAALRRMPEESATGAAPPDPGQGWEAALERAVLSAPATLEAVLHRVTLPLAAVMDFEPGMDIPLPEDALEKIALEGQGRRKLSQARLGQSRGMRALRLVETDEAGGLEAVPQRKDFGAVAAGASPFPKVDLPLEPGSLGDPMSPTYGALDDTSGGPSDAQDPLGELGGLETGAAIGGFAGLGGLGALADEKEATGDLPPLKIGSGL
ncbi:FliM/FliN family flagellar motor switch protein [Thioclava pacifica]|nr:FliM/FliN family flagellar motor C-terminal domain-containing protein [Thioclava pacifica]